MSGLTAWRFAFCAAPGTAAQGAVSARIHGTARRLQQNRPEDAGYKRADLYNDPNYLPQRPGKNPMKVLGWAWLFGIPVSVTIFILTKGQVERNRAEQLRVRRRMKLANKEDGVHAP